MNNSRNTLRLFSHRVLLHPLHQIPKDHLNGNLRRPRREHHSSSPNSQTQQHSRTQREQTKPHHNPVRQSMHKRVHNPHSHIRPGTIHRRLVVDAQVGQRQNGANEVCRLLVQVVEVLRGPLQVRRQHFLHARGCEGRVRGDFVFGEGGEAFGVHPAFHDEGPEVEGYLLGRLLVVGDGRGLTVIAVTGRVCKHAMDREARFISSLVQDQEARRTAKLSVSRFTAQEYCLDPMNIPKGASKGAATPTGALLMKDIACTYCVDRKLYTVATNSSLKSR